MRVRIRALASETVKHTPEYELLLCSSRVHLTTEHKERIKSLLHGEPDWHLLLRIAFDHRVSALLYKSLDNDLRKGVPPKLLEQLRRTVRANAARNLFLAQQLKNVLKLLHSHDIQAIPFKGPVLAVSAYGDLMLRAFSDLDVLVNMPEFTQAEQVLCDNGYRVGARWGYQSSLVDDSSHVSVDLHRALTPNRFPLRLDFQKLWNERKPILVCGEQIYGLSPEDALVVRCVQVSKDAWQGRVRLHKICDISETLRTHQDMDLEWVLNNAKRRGYQRIVFLGLSVAKDLVEAPLPERISKRIAADSSVSALCARVRRLFHETTIPTYPRWSKRFYFDLRERWRDKLYPYVAPTEKDKASLLLPASFSFLYYFIHAVRLPAKYVWRLCRRASAARQ